VRETDDILIIDDDVDYSCLMELAFKEVGVSNPIALIHDSCNALNCFRNMDGSGTGIGRPALVLLDLRMPKMDGLELLKQIREDRNLRDVPVAVFTGVEAEEELSRAAELGATSLHIKPFSYRELVETARGLQDQYLSPALLQAAA